MPPPFPEPARVTRNPHRASSHTSPPDCDGDLFQDEGVKKKRKLALRVGRKQTTLDGLGFFASADTPPRPPNKITLRRPGGKVLETVNGVQHELVVREGSVGSAEPARSTAAAPSALPEKPVGKKEEKRTLRSQDDGPRLKSELAMYFQNYEDIMFDAPQEEDFINVDSAVYIADDKARRATSIASPAKQSKYGKTSPGSARVNGMDISTSSKSAYAPGTSVLDLSTFLNTVPDGVEDPLVEAAFLKAHKRAERREKQLRNIERERAMHEKVQLDRLLEGLLGHDWLKVLGVTGVTDGEAKRYESKRAYFISEVQTLVDKFKQWKEEERRQRLEKDAARQAEEEDDGEDGTEISVSSDMAARQLQSEIAHAGRMGKRRQLSPQASRLPPATPPIPYRPPSPIMTFYSSRLLRDTALKKSRDRDGVSTRRAGQTMAFGLPMPELLEREFSLPEEYITADVLKARGRERRRRKRESTAKGVI